MNLLSVILSDYSDYIKSRLDKEIDFFLKEEVEIKKYIYDLKKQIRIDYYIDIMSLKNYDIEDFKVIFYHYIANAIADSIIHDIERKYVEKIISDEYCYFSPSERKSILMHFKNVQENEEYRYGEGVTYKISRKAKILQLLIDYLRENTEINLEGFIRFRLKSYIHELEDHVERAVDDFLMEKEYNEFIKLLKYFVDIQDAKIDTVNILMGEGGKYHLYDKSNSLINNEYLEDLASEMAEKDISYDDLLISSLITLAPKQIIIHYDGKPKNREIIQTIKSVFLDRVCVCNGCKLCLLAQGAKQE